MLFFRASCGLTAVCLCDLPCLVFTLDWNSCGDVSVRGSWKICTTYVFLKLRSQGQSLDKRWRPCACLCVWEYVCEERELSLVRGWRWICCVVSEQKVKCMMERWEEGGRGGWEASPPHTVAMAASPFFLWRVSEAFWVKMCLKRDGSHPPSTLSTHLMHSLADSFVVRYSIKHARRQWVNANVHSVSKVAASDINVYFWY